MVMRLRGGNVYQQLPEAPPTPPAKFWSEREHQWHPGTLHWPGINGYPVLGRSPGYLHKFEQERVPIVGYKHVRTFNLSDEKDHEYYCWVRDHAACYLFAIDYESHHPVECTTDSGEKRIVMYVHLEWRQFYAVVPNNLQGSQDAGRTNFDLR